MGPTILIADDEVALCDILKKSLSKEGYHVLTTHTGRDALKILKSQPVDLLILDIKMPGMSGLECLKQIRRMKNENATVPVVVLTAYGSPGSAREAMASGAIEYLAKPFDLTTVSKVVRETLAKRRAWKKTDGARRLLYIPILHTVSDMGTLATSMKEVYVRKFGHKKWVEHVDAIDQMWEGLKKRIQQLHLPYRNVKLYQDGLPVCGKEKEIVEDLTRRGSPNHTLLSWLMKQGATLVGTEDAHLLVKEYQYYKRITASKNHEERERLIHGYEKVAAVLLRKRDEQIRDRIMTTLKRGEVGVLFIGLLHKVDELLPRDIEINYLIHRLPFGRSVERKMAV